MLSLHLHNRAVDIVTVGELLKMKDELDFIGGPYYLMQLTTNVIFSQDITTYADILRGYYIKREMIKAGAQLLTAGYDDTMAPDATLELFDQKLFALTKDDRVPDIADLPSLVAQAVMRAEHLMANKQDITGVPTGFPSLDSVTFGWQPTDLIILAARPSVGKTAFALNLARNAAVRGVPSAFFSLEMSA
ncbi:MAG TPA: replicative DNA helicase, partial [Chitinophagaceae bacterium]|nr:replicative DNA helicase [Chitinophagaceae bacterium]